jgi:hypothetical protein
MDTDTQVAKESGGDSDPLVLLKPIGDSELLGYSRNGVLHGFFRDVSQPSYFTIGVTLCHKLESLYLGVSEVT